MKHLITNSFTIIGTAIFFLAFLICLLSSILFIFNYSISGYIFVISFLAAIGYCLLLSKFLQSKYGWRFNLYIVVFFAMIMIISANIANSFYDNSYDGQWYHQRAVYHLANGWNPFKEKVAIYQIPPGQSKENDLWGNVWVDHYPRASWICAASIYKLIGNIEVGKTFNIAFILGSFLLSTSALLSIKNIKPTYAYLIGFFAAFNPVSIYQSLSFYVDGQLSSLLVSLTAILCLFALKSEKILYGLLIIPIVSILANVKFTGLVYAGIILLIFSIYLFLHSSKKAFIWFAIASVLSIIIAVLIIGYNPYITNILSHGNPFYPLSGKGSVSVLIHGTPSIYFGKNRFHALLVSIFSEIPYTNFHATDNVIAGFGALFSSLFLLGSFLTLFLLITRSTNKHYFLTPIIILWSTVAVNPIMWWARYIPQLWLFPFLPTIFALTKISHAKAYYIKIVRIVVSSIFSIALINILVIGTVYIRANVDFTDQMGKILANMSEASRLNSPILITNSYRGFVEPQIHLQDRKITYKVVDIKKLPCLYPQILIGSAGSVYYCSSYK